MSFADAKHELVKYIATWKNDPVRYVYDMFGHYRDDFEVDWFQEEALYSLRDNPNTALLASKGVGKSCTMAWGGWWLMTCFEDMNLFCTSINENNLLAGLWKELAVWQAKQPMLQALFEYKKKEITLRERPHTHFCRTRTWRKDAKEEEIIQAFAGLHNPNIAFLMDETGSYPSAAMSSAEAIHSGASFSRIIQSGNTTKRSGPLWDASTIFKESWNCIHISGDPQDPKRSKIVPVKWAENEIKKYGRDHPFVQVNVLGIFPKVSLIGLVSAAELSECMDRPIPPEDDYKMYVPKVGVDMGRNVDETVIFPRQGMVPFPPVRMRTSITQEVTSRIISVIDKHFKGENPLVMMDATGGFGAGPTDMLRQARVEVQEVHFGERPAEPEKFMNARVEMWNKMAIEIKRKNFVASAAFDGPNDPTLRDLGAEFDATEYFINDNTNKMQLMPKEQIKERLQRSPDIGDALALTYYTGDILKRPQREQFVYGGRGGPNVLEYDPYSADGIP